MTSPPFPKSKTLWPLVLVPQLLGTFYILIAYPRFCTRLSFIPEHMLVLAFWMITTAFVMVLVRDFLIWRRIHFLFLATVLVPTLSCFLLYLIYGISIIGNIYLGSHPGV